jgi:hypothetical protein
VKLKPKHLETLWLALDMLGENLAFIEAAEDMDEVRHFLHCAQIDLDEALDWEQQMSTSIHYLK